MGSRNPLEPEPTPVGLATYDVSTFEHLGPVVVLLQERLTAQAAGPLSDVSRYDWALIGRHFTLEELARAAIEASLALAVIIGTSVCMEEDPSTRPSTDEVSVEAARHLALLAQSYTRVGHRPDGDDAALALEQARLCHELAAHFLTSHGRPFLTVTEADLEAHLNAAFGLLHMAAKVTGNSHMDQLEALRRGSVQMRATGT